MKIKQILLSITCLLAGLGSQTKRKVSQTIASEERQKAFFSQMVAELQATEYVPQYNYLANSNYLVSSSDLRQNSISEVSSCRGITQETLNSEGYRFVNGIGHYYALTITKIYQITGVYFHNFSYYDHDILASGALNTEVANSGNFTEASRFYFSFNESLGGEIEAKLDATANIDVVSASASVVAKSGASFSYGCSYTRTSLTSYEWKNTIHIGENCAPYCPAGYSLSVGKEGTYYVLEITVQEKAHWWWGDYDVQGSSPIMISTVLANPSDYNYCFVYKNKANTEKDYYKA